MSRPDPRALSLVDEVSARLIAMAAPFELRLAESPAELRAVYRLRYEVAVAEGWARPADLPRGLEHDPYDRDAEQVTARLGDELAAAQRIVYPSPGRRLPTEAGFELAPAAVGHAVDIGRTAIAPAFRGDPRHLLLAALEARSWQSFRRRGFHLAIGAATEALLRVYERIGLHVERLGPAREWWGETRYPALFDTARDAERLAARWGIATVESASGQ